MLAYVFWHWPLDGVSKSGYSEALREFYWKLKRQRVEGFIDCYGFRISSLPWESRRRAGYEDWYLVEDFQSLEVLNDAAVSEKMISAHQKIAKLAGGGAGGLYKLHGRLRTRKEELSVWFSKPRKTSYRQLELITEHLGVKEYWQRQMVLGPAPEFCAHVNTRVGFPRNYLPQWRKIEAI